MTGYYEQRVFFSRVLVKKSLDLLYISKEYRNSIPDLDRSFFNKKIYFSPMLWSLEPLLNPLLEVLQNQTLRSEEQDFFPSARELAKAIKGYPVSILSIVKIDSFLMSINKNRFSKAYNIKHIEKYKFQIQNNSVIPSFFTVDGGFVKALRNRLGEIDAAYFRPEIISQIVFGAGNRFTWGMLESGNRKGGRYAISEFTYRQFYYSVQRLLEEDISTYSESEFLILATKGIEVMPRKYGNIVPFADTLTWRRDNPWPDDDEPEDDDEPSEGDE